MNRALMQWFGESWEAPVCDPEQEIDIPVEYLCARCGEAFAPKDQGLGVPYVDPMAVELHRPTEGYEHLAIWCHLYFHRACFLRAMGIRE